MAEFRTIHSKMWRDNWYSELDVEGKLLWIYLITNHAASLTGIYYLPAKFAAFETGMSQERVETLLAQFVMAGKIEYENEVIWVRRMRKYQAQNESSPKIKPRIERDLAEVPDCRIKRMYLEQYRIDTISIPTLTDTDTDTNTETDTEHSGADAPQESHPKKKHDKSGLRFDATESGALMARLLRQVYESKGHRPPEHYASAMQRDAYLTAFNALGGKIASLLQIAMERDITDRARLLSWLQGCAKRNGNESGANHATHLRSNRQYSPDDLAAADAINAARRAGTGA